MRGYAMSLFSDGLLDFSLHLVASIITTLNKCPVFLKRVNIESKQEMVVKEMGVASITILLLRKSSLKLRSIPATLDNKHVL